MTDPVNCGPVCLALPQDVQAEAFDCPSSLHCAAGTLKHATPAARTRRQTRWRPGACCAPRAKRPLDRRRRRRALFSLAGSGPGCVCRIVRRARRGDSSREGQHRPGTTPSTSAGNRRHRLPRSERLCRAKTADFVVAVGTRACKTSPPVRTPSSRQAELLSINVAALRRAQVGWRGAPVCPMHAVALERLVRRSFLVWLARGCRPGRRLERRGMAERLAKKCRHRAHDPCTSDDRRTCPPTLT